MTRGKRILLEYTIYYPSYFMVYPCQPRAASRLEPRFFSICPGSPRVVQVSSPFVVCNHPLKNPLVKDTLLTRSALPSAWGCSLAVYMETRQ